MKANSTNNGKDGGLLKGKPHYDKDGRSLGGIKAVVTDTKQIVELEGGEVIINKEASKKHWKELSRINQSAGNGVPILPPDEALADVDEYMNGGNTVAFNPNNLPSAWVVEYATNIRNNYPEIWQLGGNGNGYGDEAYKNLARVRKRGYWLEGEEWFYAKWQSFGEKHKADTKLEDVVTNLKWGNKVARGWDYMKKLIEAEIKSRGLKKLGLGGRAPKGSWTDAKKRELNREHKDTRYLLLRKDGKKIDTVYSLKTLASVNAELGFRAKNKRDHDKDPNELDLFDIEEDEVVATYVWVESKGYYQLKSTMDNGGELAQGIEVEKEHTATIQKIYDHEITPAQAPEEIAKDHLDEDEKYYTRLAKIEGLKSGGKIATVMGEFKRGELYTSYGKKVTQYDQAIAIALSEQRRHDKKEFGGNPTTCNNCNHTWDRMGLGGNICDNCGHENTSKVKVIDHTHTVQIEKIDKMEKSEVFYNPEIFTEEGDYTLGGFNAEELNGIEVSGDGSALSLSKLQLIFERRLTSAVESFKKEVTANIIGRGGNTPSTDLESDVFQEFVNLLETYISEKPNNGTTAHIVSLIMNNASYLCWTERIKSRLNTYKLQVKTTDTQVNENKPSAVSVGEAENYTYTATLEQMLEVLCSINEANTI